MNEILNSRSSQGCLGVLGLLVALAALIVALLNWLSPFQPVGNSPFVAPINNVSVDDPTAMPIQEVPNSNNAVSHIIFTSDRNCNNSDWCENVYIMKSDGTETRNLTENSPSTFNYTSGISTDGTKVAFVAGHLSGGNDELYLLDLLDFSETKLIDVPGYSGGVMQISWSQGDREIVFDDYVDNDIRSVIELLDIYTKNITRLTQHSEDDTYPSWSYDGGNIVFSSGNVSSRGVYMMDRNGGNRNLLLADWSCGSFDFSPIDMIVAMTCNSSSDPSLYNSDIFLLNTTTGSLTQVTDSPSSERNPSWSPDGEWIAFESPMDDPDYQICSPAIGDDHCNNEIYIIRKDGTSLKRLTFNDADDSSPDWSK